MLYNEQMVNFVYNVFFFISNYQKMYAKITLSLQVFVSFHYYYQTNKINVDYNL